jgi:hypothetical protein
MSLLFLDIAVSLIVVFVMLSVLCSSLLEWYAQRIGARAKFLRKGLLHMLGDDGLYRQVVNHPLIEALGRGNSRAPGPAYIPSAVFADALLDSVVDRARATESGTTTLNMELLTIKDLRTYLHTLDEDKLSIASILAPIVRRTDDLNRVRADIARWYETQTDRVTGWYKAFARKHLFVLGLLIAVAFNIDIIAITKRVAAEPGLRSMLAGYATAPELRNLSDAEPSTSLDPGEQALDRAKKAKKLWDQAALPFGWNTQPLDTFKSASWPEQSLMLAGWFLTGLGVSLGAPFWFDLLNRVASLRAAGPKPPLVEEKKG